MSTEKTSTFTGSIPRHYDLYQGPMFFEEYAIDVANRVDPTSVQVALELSSGTGRVTNHLRRVLKPSAKLIASDISPDMLEVAKEKLNGLNIDWQSIDFTQIPFGDNSIDLVVCCFGYMFAENKVKAFSEALRVLRPGGSLLLTTWGKLEYNGASHVFRKTVKSYLGDSVPPMFQIPFSMNDPQIIKEQLHAAGFSKVEIEEVEKQSVCESAKKATYGMVQGGTLYNEIMKRNPAWVDEIATIVEKELTEKYGASPMVAPMRAIVCQAWKP
jgi:ubiquinone/menaquinone biosynthesis C-methylase UbiE